VVAAFNKFKDKNFTILGVSLDEDKDKMAGSDQMPITLPGRRSAILNIGRAVVVPLYKIEGIPFNVLVDPQGKIIASDLRGEDLERKLQERF
jgi:hypothetical protein